MKVSFAFFEIEAIRGNRRGEGKDDDRLDIEAFLWQLRCDAGIVWECLQTLDFVCILWEEHGGEACQVL